MSSLTEQWIVTWFPPGKYQVTKKFDDESRARDFADLDHVAPWQPALRHVVTTVVTTIVTTDLPLT